MGYIREKSRVFIGRMGVCFATVLCAALLVVLLPAKDVFAYEEGTVTATSANIRASADTNSTALASVVQGNKLTIIESVTGTDGQVWYKVFIDADSQGYIRSDLVSTSGGSVPAATPAPDNSNTLNTDVSINMDGVEAVQPVGASVTKDNVRVRADSTTDSSIVTTVREDAVLTVHGTKPGSNSEVWYQVSFMVDGIEVNGYIRSDFVTLNGELLPIVEEPDVQPQQPETPVVDTTPQPSVTETKDFETKIIDGVWYLIDNKAGQNYPISALLGAAEENADALEVAQKKVSRQTGIIVFLSIIVIIAVLGITLLIFKLRDMLEDDGLDFKSAFLGKNDTGNRQRPTRPVGNNGRKPVTRPVGSRPTGETKGTRPAGAAQGSRPAGAAQGSRPAGAAQGSRPAGAAQGSRPAGATQGSRPAGAAQGSRPAGAAQGSRPAGATQGARPTGAGQGARPAGAGQGSRPTGTTQSTATEGARPATTRPSAPVYEGTLEKQARTDVETRKLEKETADTQSHRVRNFMTDDDEFEFEFLNWDGNEEN